MYNILTEPLIRIETSDAGRVEASLPQVYAALMADEVEAFPALRPHQRHAWHAFLVQLGAMAMYRTGLQDPPDTAQEWADLIRGLTKRDFPDDEPWQLVVDDIEEPAFMQPPASSAEKSEEYGTKPARRGKQTVRVQDKDKICRCADELDMLVTSKNHDLKRAVAEETREDDWVFSLITLQTMEGVLGRGNYGISRMPSGYGNRSAFSFTPSIRLGVHFCHDLSTLLKNRQVLLDEYPMADSGISLLWVQPWDGTSCEKKQISELEPFYIEICRRVRLRWGDGELTALCANSDLKDGSRIVDLKGLVGDPWMPVSNSTNQRGTPRAFLEYRNKFSYERIVDGLTSPDWKAPILLKSLPEGDAFLVARGMVRGQGGTQGYHERVIPLRQRTLQVFGRTGGPQQLGDIARKRIYQVRQVEDILQHAIATFAAHGDSDRNSHRNRRPSANNMARIWVNQLDEIVDFRFFDHLQTEFEAPGDAERDSIRAEWLNGFVVHSAEETLRDSWESLPCPDSQHLRARAISENVFNGRIKQEFDIQL